MMSLLSPFFLLGLLGVALPVWLHRLQTQTNEREKFSSSMFLEPSEQRIHVQRKLRYLLLLALRILLLAILVLAFARPILQLPDEAVAGPRDTHHIIVLDTSFSMQRGDVFAQALTQARTLIEDMEAGDQASVYRASARLTALVEASSEPEALRAALEGVVPDNGRLDLGAMIADLNSRLSDDRANLRLHLISDFQESSQPLRFSDLIPDMVNGRPLRLSLHRMGQQSESNWAVESVQPASDEVTVNVRGYNTPAAEKTLQLLVNGEPLDEQSRTVPAAGSARFVFRNPQLVEGDNRIDARLTPSDSLAADDLHHTVLDNSPPAPVLLLTGDAGSLAVTYISAVLATAPRPYAAEVVELAELDTRILSRYPWLILEDIGALDQNLEQALLNYLNNGGAILAGLGERSAGLSRLPLGGQEVDGSALLNPPERRRIQQIDAGHPVLDATSGWGDVLIRRALPLRPAPEDQVLIALATNTPFLLERRQGGGRFMLLNTRLDNSWSDLPLKPVFVSFLSEAARYLANEDVLQQQQLTESLLQLPAMEGSSAQVINPQGATLLDLEDTTRQQDIRLGQIGYYQVITPGGEGLVAVNPDPRESDLSTMQPDVLQNWENTIAQTAAAAARGTVAEGAGAVAQEGTARVEIWRLLLILLVLAVLAESLLGNRYLRYQTGAPS